MEGIGGGGRWIKTERGKWSSGSGRDVKRSEEDRPHGAWRRVEDAEEAGWSIDYPPPPFSLKLIKVLAWFSDYPTAYGDFPLLKGSVRHPHPPPPPPTQMPAPATYLHSRRCFTTESQ